MSDPVVDEQDHKATSVEPVEAVKDSAEEPMVKVVSSDESKKEQQEAQKKEDKELLSKSEVIAINDVDDIIFWRTKDTDKIGKIGWIPGPQSLYGMPYTMHKTSKGKYKFANITLSNFDALKYPDGLRPHIHKVKNPDGSSAFLFEGKKYTQEELVKWFKPDSVKNRDFFRYALQCLRVEDQTIFEPYVIEKEDHLFFPDIKNIYADPNNQFQIDYVNNLRIGEVNQEFIQQGRDLLKKHKKQLMIYLLVPAQVVVNLLGIEDFLYTLEIISERDTGKSFAIRVALHHFEGIIDVLKGDILNTAFRNSKLLSGTNLSLYDEEGELSSKIKRSMKSSGTTARGKQNLTIEKYKQSASLILSANSSEVDDNQDEQKAIDKRFLQVFLNKQDIVPEEERTIGKKYVKRMKRENGGLLFTEILKKHTISELEDKYYELDTKYQNRLELLLHFGEFLTDINYEFPIDFGDKEEENWLRIFFEWTISLPEYYKQRSIQNNLRVVKIEPTIINKEGKEETITIVKEIIFSDEIFQLFKSDHKDLPFTRIVDFRKKYKDYMETGSFSIGGDNAYRTKLICNDKFYKFIGTIDIQL